jgi:quinol monooxygenase YgiN
MSEVVLVVTQRVHPERYEEAKAALGAMVEAVHANDEGCVLYALHDIPGDRTRLVCLEKWSSQEALEAHAARPHVAALTDVEALDGPPEVTVLQPLGYGDPVKGTL